MRTMKSPSTRAAGQHALFALALFTTACADDSPETPEVPFDASQNPSTTPDAGNPGPGSDAGQTPSGSTDGGQTPSGSKDGGQTPTGNTDAAQPTGNTDASQPTGNTDAGQPSGNTDAGQPTGNTDSGQPATGSDAAVVNPTCDKPDPSKLQPSNVGGGGTTVKESDHFRAFGSGNTDAALKLLEAAHKCFVQDWCWRSPGLSITNTSGTHYKFNLYSMGTLGNAAGVMKYDASAGLSYLQVVSGSLGEARVTVHEFGHALTLAEKGWVDQTRTGAWWETVANYVADTFITSSYCEAARTGGGIAAGNTIIDLNKIIGQSNMMIVSNQNYYEAWPFLTYLVNNPDNYKGLGRTVLTDMFRTHKRNNETPLHVLERLVAPVKVQTILGRYWAHMAYVDIGHPKAQQAFMSRRASINFANLDAAGSGSYKVKANRQPAYGGANIIPLKGSGEISVQVMNLGNGRAESNFTATLVVRASNGSVRYQDLPGGAGKVTVASGEEASLVVVNTPDQLYQYDAFNAGAPETTGLNYQVQITGATP
jgi:hypothetical protein